MKKSKHILLTGNWKEKKQTDRQKDERHRMNNLRTETLKDKQAMQLFKENDMLSHTGCSRSANLGVGNFNFWC